MMRCLSFLILLVGLVACQGQLSEDPPFDPNPNMDNQPKKDPQEPSPVFADGRAERMPVSGTMAREDLQNDPVFFLGKNADGSWVQNNPRPIDKALLQRGQERYNIYCGVCHDRVGTGKGVVTPPNYEGMVPPPSYHDDRIRSLTDGQIFDVITNGVRTMPSYRHQVTPEDRWAIVAYLRALQRSQRTTLEDVPSDIITTLEH
jgi:mono/diheme cytochrome c family protein